MKICKLKQGNNWRLNKKIIKINKKILKNKVSNNYNNSTKHE